MISHEVSTYSPPPELHPSDSFPQQSTKENLFQWFIALSKLPIKASRESSTARAEVFVMQKMVRLITAQDAEPNIAIAIASPDTIAGRQGIQISSGADGNSIITVNNDLLDLSHYLFEPNTDALAEAYRTILLDSAEELEKNGAFFDTGTLQLARASLSGRIAQMQEHNPQFGEQCDQIKSCLLNDPGNADTHALLFQTLAVSTFGTAMPTDHVNSKITRCPLPLIQPSPQFFGVNQNTTSNIV